MRRAALLTLVAGLATLLAFAPAALADEIEVREVALRRVEDGKELMDTLLNTPAKPSLILLDLNMPRKNGLEALKEIRANNNLRQIPVVMLTISNNHTEIKLSYFLGANSFITKPLIFDHLVKMLEDLRHYWFETVKLPS